MIEEAIFDILSNDSDVGSIFGDRIRPDFAPQGDDEPYIVYEVDSLEPSINKDDPAVVDFYDVTIRLHAKDHKNIRDGGNYVRNALDFFKGTRQGTDINRAYLNNVQDRFDDEGELHIREHTYQFRVTK